MSIKLHICLLTLFTIFANAEPDYTKAFAAVLSIVKLQAAIRVDINSLEDIPENFYKSIEEKPDDPLMTSDNLIPSIEATVLIQKSDVIFSKEQISAISASLLKSKWKAEFDELEIAGMGVSPTVNILIPDNKNTKFFWLLEFHAMDARKKEYSVVMRLARPCGAGCFQHLEYSKHTVAKHIPVLDELCIKVLSKDK